jgi:hypothetical protein
MISLQVDILNPKARKLLNDLADQKLIAITELRTTESFLKTVNKIRRKGKRNPISEETITKEVEAVRASRYAKKKKQNNR